MHPADPSAPLPDGGPACSPPWRGGWYAPATALPSQNFGARPPGAAIDLVVVHSISLPPGAYGTGEVQRLFTNALDWDAHPYYAGIRGLQVSAHFFIERDGKVWQFVSCDDRAWHAGPSAYRGRENCNNDSIGIELEGLEGDRFEPAQYQALVVLCRDIAHRYPVAHIAGHEHVAPGRKRDPGPGFDWNALERGLDRPAIAFPPQVNPS
jgi:AmpD protein